MSIYTKSSDSLSLGSSGEIGLKSIGSIGIKALLGSISVEAAFWLLGVNLRPQLLHFRIFRIPNVFVALDPLLTVSVEPHPS